MSKLLKHLTKSILILLIVLQISSFAQTKIDEYKRITTDEETARIDLLIIDLLDKPTARGLFIVYSGDDKFRIGNLIPYIDGVKHQFSLREFDTSRISFVIAKGKELFKREIWVVSQNEKNPEFEETVLELNNLKENYLYALSCIECEPSQPNLSMGRIDWDFLAKTLKKNSKFKVFIQLGENSEHYNFDKEKMVSAKEFVKDLRSWFSKEYKIDKKRFSYKVVKEEFAKIYIIPNKEIKNYVRSNKNRYENKDRK